MSLQFMAKLSGVNTRSIGISHQVIEIVYRPLKILHSQPFIKAVYSFGILRCKYWRHKTINSIRQLQVMHGVCISDHKSYRFGESGWYTGSPNWGNARSFYNWFMVSVHAFVMDAVGKLESPSAVALCDSYNSFVFSKPPLCQWINSFLVPLFDQSKDEINNSYDAIVHIFSCFETAARNCTKNWVNNQIRWGYQKYVTRG